MRYGSAGLRVSRRTAARFIVAGATAVVAGSLVELALLPQNELYGEWND